MYDIPHLCGYVLSTLSTYSRRQCVSFRRLKHYSALLLRSVWWVWVSGRVSQNTTGRESGSEDATRLVATRIYITTLLSHHVKHKHPIWWHPVACGTDAALGGSSSSSRLAMFVRVGSRRQTAQQHGPVHGMPAHGTPTARPAPSLRAPLEQQASRVKDTRTQAQMPWQEASMPAGSGHLYLLSV
jgi:hypothetical protein